MRTPPINNASGPVVVDEDGTRLQVNRNGSVTAPGAEESAIQVNALDVEVRNIGEISGGLNGINFVAEGQTDSSVFNAGTITSDSRAVNLDGDGISLRNFGDILGTGDQRNGTVYLDGSANNFDVQNQRRGLIDAGEGNNGSGISVQVGTGDGDSRDGRIINRGEINGRGEIANADVPSGIRLFNGAGEGNGVTFTGDIINSRTGVITAEAPASVAAGVLVQNGVNFQGALRNQGEISGGNNGVYFGTGDHTGGLFVNRGTLSSDSRALNIDGIGLGVVNFGDILGTGSQRNGTLYSDNTADLFSIDNSGTIDAGVGNNGAAISLSLGETLNATVDNSGTIAGRGQVAAPSNQAGDGIRLSSGVEGPSTFTGSITNSGDISSESAVGPGGGFRSANGVNFQGTLTNEQGGTISGVNNGVYFGTGDHAGGLFLNEGLVTSDSRAVNLDGDGLTFVNSGTILGTADQRNGTVYQDGTGDNISITNLTGGVIDAGAGNNGSGISVQVGEANGDERSGSISNEGLVQGRGDGNVPAGLRLFTSADNATYNGDIFNGPNGVIASETLAGLLIEDAVTFNGTITNEGVITGGNGLAVDASGTAGDIALVNSGELNGAVRLGSGNDSFVTSQLVQFDGGAGVDSVDFSGLSENASGGVFNGVIIDLDVNSAGANGTPSQEGAILNAPPAAGGQQIADLEVDDVENVVGTNFNDGLFGNNEVNVLESGAGNDLIHGFGGSDFLSGGAGTDTVLFSAAPAGVTVDLNDQVSATDFAAIVAGDSPAVVAASGGAGNNVLSGFENVTGSQSGDLLTGDALANVLNGNGGNDSLVGGGGNDTLIGGGGLDSFVFAAGSGQDEVTDFDALAGELLDVGAIFADAGTALGAAAQNGADTVLDLGGGNQVTLLGLTVDELSEANFIA